MRVVTCSLIAASIVACVGDDNIKDVDSSTDSSTLDSPSNSDTNPGNDGSSSDAGVFDGANANCNGIFPSQAPAQATVECADAAPVVAATGGVIPPGRYYIADEKFFPVACSLITGPFNDVVEIAALDGGSAYTVNVALDGTGARRLTLLWTIESTTGYFDQSTLCPAADGGVNKIPYNVTVAGSTTHVQYSLPSYAAITLTSF